MRREIHERTFQLARSVATLRSDPALKSIVKDVILRQLARAAFSVASNLEESLAAHSKADFAAKVAISAKEGREMNFWLRLGTEAGVLTPDESMRLMPEAREVSVVISTIARRARMNPSVPIRDLRGANR
ncbi:four helix bundle protein [Luteitalea pratensis]|uniref:Four helix bundle protein n=1 Tax=Luteitalea pratensis TaxID=1855912 RepID=A0A143PTJ6_LUTPR|nr:four helix bundle protein [Luteitalea pratensis]AMY11656.1 four helix bundle protein [Luteitalea pratensis]